MNSFAIAFDWENAQGAKGAELRATWARLTISVDGTAISEISDGLVRNVGDSVYMPLYPLAEWVVERWWNLFYEPQTPGRATARTYAQRHSLLYAGEGFVMPDLTIVPMGETSVLSWKAYRHAHSPVRFIASGTGTCRTSQVCEEFERLVDAVVSRLQQEGLSDTYLEREWNEIKATGTEEREFCEAAAALGLDPYGLDEVSTRSILEVADRLPRETRWDFFGSADPVLLQASLREMEEARSFADETSVDLALGRLRDRVIEDLDPRRLPWDRGYWVARETRRALGDSFDLVGLVAKGSNVARSASRWFDGLARIGKDRRLSLSLPRTHLVQARFTASRVLFEYLTAPEDQWRLIARSHNDEQASNRAFAAEFLVPAGILADHLSANHIDQEEVEDLATRFNVSPWVVRHQIENNDLATISSE